MHTPNLHHISEWSKNKPSQNKPPACAVCNVLVLTHPCKQRHAHRHPSQHSAAQHTATINAQKLPACLPARGLPTLNTTQTKVRRSNRKKLMHLDAPVLLLCLHLCNTSQQLQQHSSCLAKSSHMHASQRGNMTLPKNSNRLHMLVPEVQNPATFNEACASFACCCHAPLPTDAGSCPQPPAGHTPTDTRV